MATAYFSLGSNMGDREANLRAALERLDGPGVQVVRESSIYATEPFGETAEPVPAYLNCVVQAETSLAAEQLLQYTQALEQALGRTPSFRWGPRLIDIDILLYGVLALNTERLTIPHPRMHERRFVLEPLAEISPDLRMSDGTSIRQLLARSDVAAQQVERWPASLNPEP